MLSSRVEPARFAEGGDRAEARRLLGDGIAAAQSGENGCARALLERSAALDPGNERVWLWLASMAASPRDAIPDLRRALEIDPSNALARSALDRILRHEGLTPVADPAALEAQALAEAQAAVEAEAQAVPGEDRGFLLKTSRVPPRASVRTAILPAFDVLTGEIHVIGDGWDAANSRLVMVVDDSPTNQKAVAVTLERHGHRVVAARGVDALEELDRAKPDLILLDSTIAQADGYRMCKALRSRLGSRGVPLVLAGADGVIDRIRGWLAGASDSIAKPFAETALVSIVDRHAAARG